MSPELEQAGLPSSFTSTKVVKNSTAKNRKKKAQKKRNKKHNNKSAGYDEDAGGEHFNYAEEFKVIEVLKEYRNPFTILMSKSERYKEDDDCYVEEEQEQEYTETEDCKSEECDADESVVTKKKKTDLLQKYYQQRYDYFSLFDEGIHIDEEGWYSVTPEVIADHIAAEAHSIALTNKTDHDTPVVVLDAFCGVGGNTIQFAKRFDRVIAVDLDAGRLEMARHNAQIYGLSERIRFIQGDVFSVLPDLADEGIDVVFMSPPWGGPDYINRPVFCPRNDLLEKRGVELFQLGRSVSKNLILFLPRQTDIFAIAEMVQHEKKENENNNCDDCEKCNNCDKCNDSFVVEQHWLRNRLKAISIYFYP